MIDTALRNGQILKQGVGLEELKKQHALEWHDKAYKEYPKYNLPYRIVYDYYHTRFWNYEKWEEYEKETPLNIYYPIETIPSVGLWKYDTDGHYTEEEWDNITANPKYIDDTEHTIYNELYNIPRHIVPPEIASLIEEKEKQYALCYTDTAAGLKAWVYYFTVFIMPYADTLKDFSVFDMYGDTRHTDQELNERKQYYMDLIKQCKEKPELYKHSIVKKTDNDIEVLYSERGTMPNYEKASRHKDTMQYRLKWLIKLFEQESMA